MNKRGQSIIEYTLIAVLVILGIVIMGPYVLRSVGAHFKLWDVGIQEGFQENIVQAPPSVIPPINTTCTCTDTALGCGNTLIGTCGPSQMMYAHNCVPQLCDSKPTSYCSPPVSSCCTQYYPVGCGDIPIPLNNGVPDPSLETFPATPPTECYYGQFISASQCSNTAVQCTANSSCNPKCIGTIPSAGALFCANNSTTPPTTNLSQNSNITYVGTCPANPQCQMYCVAPYILNPQNTACILPTTTTQLPVCSATTGGSFTGTWTGAYHDSPTQGNGTQWDSVTCNSSGQMQGICTTNNYNSHPPRGTEGTQPTCGPGPNGTVGCDWTGPWEFWTQIGTSYTMNCTNEGISSVVMTGGPAIGSAECNWSGTQDMQDFGSGNDMYLTCVSGVITQFQYYCGTTC
jgi:hypothetical protein